MDFKDYTDRIEGQKKRLGVTNEDLFLTLERRAATVGKLIADPGEMTLRQFQALNKKLHINAEIVLR